MPDHDITFDIFIGTNTRHRLSTLAGVMLVEPSPPTVIPFMSNPNAPDPETGNESTESFGELFSQYEKSHARKPEDAGKPREATVIALTADSVLLDIGFKSEGILPLTAFRSDETVSPGDKLLVTVKGRGPEGYYELARGKARRVTDWAGLEASFAAKSPISGTVTAAVKGGFSVDIGIRAFMPASRSGARTPAEMEALVGQDIRCRIIKLDQAEEDVVVDRRSLAEEEELAGRERRYSELREGDTVTGAVRSLADYGAFVDIGGVDALLHVADISWRRVAKPSDILSVGQQVEATILKIDPEKRRISLGMKQLQAHPWDAVAGKYNPGERVRGTVTRIADFGAFVELEPGVEGLIHISEMSWGKKVRRPEDLLKPGETVEAVVLGVSPADRRLSLGLKQALGDPWSDVPQRFAAGSVVDGPITSITKFGAFVQLAEGVEGMIHVSEISPDKRINHPQDVLRLGQNVQALVLAVEPEKRQLRLSMKQLVPTGLDEYLAEHKPGDVVSGRLVEVVNYTARVELGQGIYASCPLPGAAAQQPAGGHDRKPVDLSSLTSMLSARWKGNSSTTTAAAEPLRTGQIRNFRIAQLDPAAKKIELELSS